MTQEQVKTLTDSLGLVATGLGVVSMLVPKWRIAFLKALQRVSNAWSKWRLSDLYENQERALALLESGKPQWDEAARMATEHSTSIKELTKIVTNGLSHSVLMLLAGDRADFESRVMPAFRCDSKGANTHLSAGYLKMVGVDRQSLTGNLWEEVIYGDLKEQYLQTFDRCSKTGEDFIASVDFRHPVTTKHRGRWRIHAPCQRIGEHLMFLGQPVLAEDETAAQLVRDNNWPIAIASELNLRKTTNS